MKAFSDHARAERGQMTCYPRPLSVWRRRIEGLRLFEQSHSRIDGCHLVIMREIGIYSAIKGECDRRRVEGSVGLGAVVDWSSGQSREQFIDIADALYRTKRLTIPTKQMISIKENQKDLRSFSLPSPIEFIKVTEVFKLSEIFGRENGTERTSHIVCSRLEGAERNQIGDIFRRQISASRLAV